DGNGPANRGPAQMGRSSPLSAGRCASRWVEDPSMADYTTADLTRIPEGLPVPVDDGRARHLTGIAVPSVPLQATTGEPIDLSTIPGRAVGFAYPRTGQAGQPPLVPDWDLIPGARGCTPETCAFRDLAADFGKLGIKVFGLSTQEPAYQRELAE